MRTNRGLVPLLAAFLSLLGTARLIADTYPRQPGLDVLHYAFHLTLSDDTDAIEGETTVVFKVVRDGLETLSLDLVQPKPEAPEKGMRVSAVTEKGKAVRFEHAADRLVAHLEPTGRAGETRELVVSYRGVPMTGLLIAPNKHGERTFFSDNWPIKARQWLPTVDHPYDKATTEMFVNAPAHYQVVSNGLLVEETDLGGDRRLTHWRNSAPIATWLNVLGVARFAVDHRPSWRGLAIDTWSTRWPTTGSETRSPRRTGITSGSAKASRPTSPISSSSTPTGAMSSWPACARTAIRFATST